ncbi:MAG: type II/IV secretion system protein [Alphaproteobacteria bacterium]|nr:type II/IV secretion system protein [Alphaproteobacteria bacterium]
MTKIFKLHKDQAAHVMPMIGERLVQHGDITTDQLHIALYEQQTHGGLLGRTLAKLGFISEERLAAILAEMIGAERLDLGRIVLDAGLCALLPPDFSAQHRLLPIAMRGSVLSVAIADPYNVLAIDALRRCYPDVVDIHLFIATESQLDALLHDLLVPKGQLQTLVAALGDNKPVGHQNISVSDHPVVRFVDGLIHDAAGRNASDIHLEPAENGVQVRYRCDGELLNVLQIHKSHWQAVLHRLKIMAGMDIADTRNIKDGRFHIHYCGVRLDCRVAMMPTMHGENVVIRVLDPRRLSMGFAELGFTDEAQHAMQSLMAKKSGIVLVVGPTGSGKTTTMYAMLRQLREHNLNIMTLEEPVEYDEAGLRQTSIDEEKGFGFAEGVRGLLRQDPDVIMIGEIRDADTAQMAMRAAMTGHKVISALHCRDALAALSRLRDLGVANSVMAEQITGIVAQRLVRKLCPQCEDAGTNCHTCEGTGLHGRMVIAEVVSIDDGLAQMIASGERRAALEAHCSSIGQKFMTDDAQYKIQSGRIAESALHGLLREGT